MSHLHAGDEDLHYCDNSHRWVGPLEVSLDVWQAQVRAHMLEHLVTMGGAATPAPVTQLPRHVYPERVDGDSRRTA